MTLRPKRILQISDNTSTQKLVSAQLTKRSTANGLAVVPEPYKTFLKMKYGKVLHEYSVIYFEEKDMDLDGDNEALVGIGSTNAEPSVENFVERELLLRKHDSRIMIISDEDLQGGYGCFNIKFVQMQGEQQYYIYRQVTNAANLIGFSLLKLENSKLVYVENSASATGAGQDSLTDVNHDNKYDGYIASRASYDVCYYPVDANYIFEKGSFKISKVNVDLSEIPYPDNIRDVVLQFIGLKLLSTAYQADQIVLRLNELCKDKKLLDVEWTGDGVWYDLWQQCYIEDENDKYIQVRETRDEAMVNVFYREQETAPLKSVATFHLTRSGKKWRITEIED